MKANGRASHASTPLTEAAAGLDAELRRYQDIAASALRVPLTSVKNVDRATESLTQAAEAEQRVLDCVKALVEAVSTARESQTASNVALNERATLVATRRAEIEQLLERFLKIGEVAKTLNESMQKVSAYKGDPYSPEASEVGEALKAIENGMSTCADHAQDLAKDAQAKEIEDVARQADSLRQQVLATKNRLNLLQKTLTTRSTS